MVHVGVGDGLLRRHVGRRPDRHAGRCSPEGAAIAGGVERLGDSEVGDHRRAARHENVVRLDVAVDDVVTVRVGERARNLSQDADRLVERRRSVADETRAQRFAVDERHGEVGQAVKLAGGEKRHDVRVLESRGDRDLTPEPFDREMSRHLGR